MLHTIQRVKDAIQARKKNKDVISTEAIRRDVHSARISEYLGRLPDRSVLRAAALRTIIWLTDPSEKKVHKIMHNLKGELHMRSRGPSSLRRQSNMAELA